MDEIATPISYLEVGSDRRKIAYQTIAAGGDSRPGAVWLGGFRSDMSGTKAQALADAARNSGRAFLRFDYSGHGMSGGTFEAGAISRWLEETLAVIRAATLGPQILVGSSMGGWLALLAARAFHATGEDRIAGMVLLAPAVDFTQDLMWEALPEEARREILEKGVYLRPSAYSDEPTPITRRLIEDGKKHFLLNDVIRSYGPTHVLQGMQDPDVPWRRAIVLMERLVADPASLTLIKDGDHRLSRPQDIALLLRTVDALF